MHLTDTGFAPTAKLTVTATLKNTIRASSHHVCFHSTVPFKSQQHPTVKKAGTALLLNCSQVANVAPCITSTKQVGKNLVVKLVVPGGDPILKIVTNPNTKIALPAVPAGTIGRTYAGRLTTTGGLAPITWKLASGKLPVGSPSTSRPAPSPASRAPVVG